MSNLHEYLAAAGGGVGGGTGGVGTEGVGSLHTSSHLVWFMYDLSLFRHTPLPDEKLHLYVGPGAGVGCPAGAVARTAGSKTTIFIFQRFLEVWKMM